MNENNYNPQTGERAPLPNYEATQAYAAPQQQAYTAPQQAYSAPQQAYSAPQQAYYAAPQQTYYAAPQPQPNAAAEAMVAPIASSAFGKGLASTIMSWFPITSIIAIFLGGASLGLVKEAKAKAAQYGVSAGGKCVAAKILGTVGLVSSIIMTVFWVIYIIAIAALASSF